MKAYAVDPNNDESMRIVEFDTVKDARAWIAFMNAHDNGNYTLFKNECEAVCYAGIDPCYC